MAAYLSLDLANSPGNHFPCGSATIVGEFATLSEAIDAAERVPGSWGAVYSVVAHEIVWQASPDVSARHTRTLDSVRVSETRSRDGEKHDLKLGEEA